MKMTHLFAFPAFVILLSSVAQAATLKVYISAPGFESSSVMNIVTEDFDSLSTGQRTTDYNSAIGLYKFSEGNVSVQVSNQYGGAGTPGTNYIALGSQSNTTQPFTLELSGPANYFGFWFSAGDPNNGISLYSEGTLLARYSTANIVSLLSGPQVQAIDGTFYNSGDYRGKPLQTTESIDTPRQNSGENYAYVSIYADGVSFDELVFDNSDTTGTGFESDNHSIHYASLGSSGSPDSTSVLVTDIPVVPVPEPAETSALLLCLGACIMLGRFGFRHLPQKAI